MKDRLEIEATNRLKKILECKDFNELIEQYGKLQELQDAYENGVQFAPSKKRFILDRISTQELILKKYNSEFVLDNDQKISLGEYKRIGHSWVEKGYNVTTSDFEALTYRNSMVLSVPKKWRSQTAWMLLNGIASGGALAFHLAFLRDELEAADIDSENLRERKIEIKMKDDLEFIKGKIELVFTPQGDNGHYKVVKDSSSRKYSIRQYWDLHLRNWESEIDNAKIYNDKIMVVNNAIFGFKKDLLGERHLGVRTVMNENLEHLYSIREYLERTKDTSSEISALKKSEKKKNNFGAPVLALLCYLINESGIDKKDESESIEYYCKRICERYKFPYRDRIRQNFSGSNTKKNRTNLIEKVLPLLEPETKDKIQEYLDSKNLQNPKMYV